MDHFPCGTGKRQGVLVKSFTHTKRRHTLFPGWLGLFSCPLLTMPPMNPHDIARFKVKNDKLIKGGEWVVPYATQGLRKVRWGDVLQRPHFRHAVAGRDYTRLPCSTVAKYLGEGKSTNTNVYVIAPWLAVAYTGAVDRNDARDALSQLYADRYRQQIAEFTVSCAVLLVKWYYLSYSWMCAGEHGEGSAGQPRQHAEEFKV